VRSEHEAATAYIEAARCWIKAGDAKMGTEVLETEALPRIVDAGKLSQAAKLHNEVAEMMESEGAMEEAISHFQQAADLFIAENAASTALKCSTRIAHLSAQMDPPDLARAAEVFEHVGTESLSSNLLKFGAKSAFFNAVLCTLARGDVVAGERDLERFKELDYTFPGCRECKLLEDVVQVRARRVHARRMSAVVARGGGGGGGAAAGRIARLPTLRVLSPHHPHRHSYLFPPPPNPHSNPDPPLHSCPPDRRRGRTRTPRRSRTPCSTTTPSPSWTRGAPGACLHL
jgi:hypothetical protein